MEATDFGELVSLPPKINLPVQRILVVEDDTLVRELVVEILESSGYEVLAVDGSISALHMLAGDTAFDVMLTDVEMPNGVSGLQLAQEVRHRFPDLAIILSTGRSELSGDPATSPLNLSILRKPYRVEDLSKAIDDALEGMPKVA